jgi:hypothetical protein
VAGVDLPHTPSTYHRTWETGLGVEIRVATVSPDFFVSSAPANFFQLRTLRHCAVPFISNNSL